MELLFPTRKSERAYQKQPTVFQNKKRLPGAKKISLKRYTRPVGLGFKTPNEVNVDFLVESRLLVLFHSK